MDEIIRFLIEWGYLGMFISAFLAGSVLPFSSEAVMVSCLLVAKMNPVLCVAFTAAGNALGGFTCYGIGWLGKKEWINRYFRVSEKDLARAEHFVQGRGAWIAFFSFIPIIGDALLIVLGLMRADKWRVLVYMTLGKVLRYALLAMTVLGIIDFFGK
ncbi:MAG: VTT domain-containing protein [Phocaeicola sp.]|nr:VTT domain-containing protein [Phocaeicola sp.]